MKLINLTRHDIVLAPTGLEGPTLTIPPSGQVARVVQGEQKPLDPIEVEGLPVAMEAVTISWPTGEVEGLPEPQEGVLYVVSTQTTWIGAREDLVAPDTGPWGAIRDEDGRIVATRRLVRWTAD